MELALFRPRAAADTRRADSASSQRITGTCSAKEVAFSELPAAVPGREDGDARAVRASAAPSEPPQHILLRQVLVQHAPKDALPRKKLFYE